MQDYDTDFGKSIHRALVRYILLYDDCCIYMQVAMMEIGLWLHPKDVELMLNELDGDGGGEIDEEEFTTFWNATIDLDIGEEIRTTVGTEDQFVYYSWMNGREMAVCLRCNG